MQQLHDWFQYAPFTTFLEPSPKRSLPWRARRTASLNCVQSTLSRQQTVANKSRRSSSSGRPATRCLRFASKMCQGLRIARKIGRKKLQRDKAVQPCVFCFVNHTHSTATELLDNLIMRDGLADHGVNKKFWRRMLGRYLTEVKVHNPQSSVTRPEFDRQNVFRACSVSR